MPPQKFNQLFVRANYKFSTADPSRPLTTWYFGDKNGNHGRYRRAHQGGETLVYQGKCGQLFISTNFRTEVESGAEIRAWPRAELEAQTDSVRKHLLSDLAKIYEEIKLDRTAFAGKASLTPQNGWHVFDWRLDRSNAHGSAGLVLLQDPEARSFFLANPNLNGYTGKCVDWD